MSRSAYDSYDKETKHRSRAMQMHLQGKENILKYKTVLEPSKETKKRQLSCQLYIDIHNIIKRP